MGYAPQAFLMLPDTVREEVAELIRRTRGQSRFNQADLEYLFKVWNRYFAPKREPLTMDCGGCISTVVGKLRYYVSQYDAQHEPH